MPLQILQREKLDPSGATQALQGLQEAINAKRDAENKAAQIRYYADELKLKSKMSDDEVEKVKLQNKAARWTAYAKVFGDAVKSGDPQGYIMSYTKMFPEMVEDLGSEEDFRNRLGGVKQGGEDQLMQAAASQMNNMQSGQEQGVVNPNQIGAVSGNTPVITGLHAGPLTMEFPNAIAQIEAAKQRGQYQGKKAMSGAEAKAALDTFFSLDDMIQRGSNFPSRIAAGMGTKLGALNQDSVPGQIAEARKGAVLNLRTFIARLKDVGNLNLNEQEAAQQLIPNEWSSEGTKQIQKGYLYDLMDAYNNGDGGRVKKIIADYVRARGGQSAAPVSPVASGDYTIKVKQ